MYEKWLLAGKKENTLYSHPSNRRCLKRKRRKQTRARCSQFTHTVTHTFLQIELAWWMSNVYYYMTQHNELLDAFDFYFSVPPSSSKQYCYDQDSVSYRVSWFKDKVAQYDNAASCIGGWSRKWLNSLSL